MTTSTTHVRLGPRFLEAVEYANRIHAEDVRKGSDVPYVSHLLGACSLVLEDHGDEDEAIGALLHDTVEDHGRHLLDEITTRFGVGVAAIVKGCSDSMVEEGAAKPPWRQRKEAYLAHITEVESQPVLRVSNADKLHNARAMLADYRIVGETLWERFNADARSAADHLWYYSSLAAIFEDRRPESFLAAELRATVEALRDSTEAAAAGVSGP